MSSSPDDIPARARTGIGLRLLDLASLALVLLGVAWVMWGLMERDDLAIIGATSEAATASIVPPQQLEDAATPGELAAEPLVTLANAPQGARSSRVVVCFGADVSQDELADLTAGLEVVWLAADGAVLARQPFDDEATRAPRYGVDRRCAELPAVELDSDSGAYAVYLAGELDLVQRDQLADVPVSAMLVDATPVRRGERLAVLLLIVAMVLRLLLWQGRRPSGPADMGRWRAFDPVLGIGAAFVLTAVVATLLAPARDSAVSDFSGVARMEEVVSGTFDLGPVSQSTFLMLISSVAVYLGVAWLMARWRSPVPSTALKATHASRFGVVWPFIGGLALALVASLLLANIMPETTSPMQWMTAVPGTMLATAAMACLSPWFEEVFFRGFLFGSIEGVAGRYWAAILSAGLFVLAHVPQHMGFLLPLVPILTVTLVATLLRFWSGSTTPSFALHLGYNSLLIVPALFAM